MYAERMDVPLLGQVATQGVLGILLALSLGANWYFIKTLQAVNDKRVEDAQHQSNTLTEPLTAVKTNSELLIALFTKFLQNNGTK